MRLFERLFPVGSSKSFWLCPLWECGPLWQSWNLEIKFCENKALIFSHVNFPPIESVASCWQSIVPVKWMQDLSVKKQKGSRFDVQLSLAQPLADFVRVLTFTWRELSKNRWVDAGHAQIWHLTLSVLVGKWGPVNLCLRVCAKIRVTVWIFWS